MKNIPNLNHAAPNLVLICIDSKEEAGYLYHRYSKSGSAFSQYAELILELEHLLDMIGYPQSDTQIREFGKVQKSVKPTVKERSASVWGLEEMLMKRGKLATLLVHVKWRQNSTWQGECYWIEKDRTEFFSSELDLLKLMDIARRI